MDVRRYYQPTETGFYYLQSRYYDPIVKRFLNADSYGSTGQGFTGYNMFAYCGNNPANGSDPTGQWIIADGLEWLWDNVVEPAAEWVSDEIIEPVVKYVNNDDPKYCENHFFSFYRGAPVFNVESKFIEDIGLTSWSFGVIVLNNKKGDSDFEDTLKHEYGHTVQMKNLGIAEYSAKVAGPSIVYNLMSRGNEYLSDLYYCMPWERVADYFGNPGNRSFSYSWSRSLYNNPKWIEKCLKLFGGTQ